MWTHTQTNPRRNEPPRWNKKRVASDIEDGSRGTIGEVVAGGPVTMDTEDKAMVVEPSLGRQGLNGLCIGLEQQRVSLDRRLL